MECESCTTLSSLDSCVLVLNSYNDSLLFRVLLFVPHVFRTSSVVLVNLAWARCLRRHFASFVSIQESESLHVLVARYGVRNKDLFECVNKLVPTLTRERIQRTGRILAITVSLHRDAKAAQQNIDNVLSHAWGIDKHIFRQFLHRRQLEFVNPTGRGGTWKYITHSNGRAKRIGWEQLCQLPVRIIYRRAILPLLHTLVEPLLQDQSTDKQLQVLLDPTMWQVVKTDDDRKCDLLHIYLALPVFSNPCITRVLTDRVVASLASLDATRDVKSPADGNAHWTEQQRDSFALVDSFFPWTALLRAVDRAEAAFPEFRSVAEAQSWAREEKHWLHECQTRAVVISSLGVRLRLNSSVPTSHMLGALTGHNYLSRAKDTAWTRQFKSTAQFLFLHGVTHPRGEIILQATMRRHGISLRRRDDRTFTVYASRCSGSHMTLLLLLRKTMHRK